MQTEKEGVTLLVTLAIRDGNTVIVGLPIDKGAAVNAADGVEKSPLMVARDEHAPQLSRLI